MKRVFMVRHGPTHAKSMVGWSDIPADLSDEPALTRLRAALPEAPVVSSDLIRAVATADAVQETRLRLPHDADLRELHFGAWELRRWDDVNAEDPQAIRAFWEKPGDTAPPGGESWNTLSRRVTGAVDRLLDVHNTIVIVAHFGAILAQAQRAAGWTAQEAFAHKVEPLSLSETVRHPEGWELLSLGEQP